MRTPSVLTGVVVSCGAMTSVAVGQAFTIEMRAPDQVLAGESFIVEAWGLYNDGDANSALAGFVGDAVALQGAGGVAGLDGVPGGAQGDSGQGLAVYPSYLQFTETAQANGADLVGAQGGQLANLFGALNPGIQTGSETLLFSFQVTTASDFEGTISYTLSNPGVAPTLVFFPENTSGSTVGSDAAGLSVVDSATRVLIPAPGMASVGLCGMLLMSRRRR